MVLNKVLKDGSSWAVIHRNLIFEKLNEQLDEYLYIIFDLNISI
jgi:hypothetical protein